jgi:protein required for attachment to host cells
MGRIVSLISWPCLSNLAIAKSRVIFLTRGRASFAKEICTVLLKGWQDKRFSKLTLVAEPKFLGVLRGELDNQLKPLVELELNKDYSHSNGLQLREQLQAHKAKS